MSGIFFVNPVVFDAVQALKAVEDKTLLVADMGGENVFSSVFDGFCKEFCLVIGNEAHGVSEGFLSHADKVVSIPMNPQMESLNAGVSCAVILYRLLNEKL